MDITLRSAIALNNMGVALLEKRCYFQALVTLRDAITLIKLKIRSGNHNSQLLSSCALAESKYFEAVRRFANPIEFKCHSIETESETHSVSQNWCSTSILEKISRTSFIFSVIRIEDFDMNVRQDAESLSTEMAVMMYNIGVAYVAMSLVVPSNSNNETVRQRGQSDDIMLMHRNTALKSFHLAQRLCETTLKSASNKHMDVREIYKIMAMVTNAGTKTSLQATEADFFLMKLSKISAIMVAMERRELKLSMNLLGAAAA